MSEADDYAEIGSSIISSPFASGGIFRTVTASSRQTYSYGHDVTNVLSPPVLSRYRSKYEQLNAVTADDDDAADADFYSWGRRRRRGLTGGDLELREMDDDDDILATAAAPALSGSSNNNVVENSSLLYQHNGRLLLKLPQDHVRLVVDQDLPVGSLSVEQWREGPDDGGGATSEGGDEEEGTLQELRQQRQLHYVLVVPDDLYRRLVGEMSDAITGATGRCGCFVPENGHGYDRKVDIRIAAAIVAVTLLILLIATLDWGGK